jgi:adenylate cyclase
VSIEFSDPDARTSINVEHLRIGDLVVPVDGEIAALVPYRGRFGSFPYISVTDVLNERVDPAQLKDKIVLLGTTAAGLLDLRSTPVGQNFAGVEVHANLVSGILDGRVKHKPTYYAGIEFSMLLVITLVLAWAFPRLSPLAGAGLALGLIAAVIANAMWAWSGSDFVMPLGVPVVFTLLLFMTHLLLGYFVESRRARDTQQKFGQYVPPQIVAEMAESGERISMEGESREMSVLFSDVRGFTDISEKLEARELSALMNAFLTHQTAAIQRHRGTIDKYMGDAIMAFWGAPLPDPAHAQHALESAMELVGSLHELDREFAQHGWPALHVGVGINSGKMHVGNMGSSFRVAYTVMGDAVNLGSRVEGLTKQYGVAVLCTESTRAAASRDWAFREIDLVRVKGRAEPVAIYEPLGLRDRLDEGLRQDLARHRTAIKLYREQRWDEAEAEFFGLSRSGRPHRVYDVFLDRIGALRAEPPGANWDGVFTHLHK